MLHLEAALLPETAVVHGSVVHGNVVHGSVLHYRDVLYHGNVLHHRHLVHHRAVVYHGTHHTVHWSRQEATALLLVWLWLSEHYRQCHHGDES